MSNLIPIRPQHISLYAALTAMWRRPFAAFIQRWSWKTAIFSVSLRAGIFFASNLRSGERYAIQAMLLEAAFTFVASGLLGAVTQDLRDARPRWATTLIIWIGIPVVNIAAEFGVHYVAGTPHVRVGLLVSFLFAAIASGFTWFAMERGTLLAGNAAGSIVDDLRQMPGIILDFVLAGPRALIRALTHVFAGAS